MKHLDLSIHFYVPRSDSDYIANDWQENLMVVIIDRGLAGPGDPIYTGGVRVSSVLGLSALIKNSPKNANGEEPVPAASDPMLPAMNGIEEWLRKEAEKYGAKVCQIHRTRTSKFRQPRFKRIGYLA